MAKYRNTTGMSQVVVLQGMKTIVGADFVIEADGGFSQLGFERVDDSVPSNIVAGSFRRRRLVSENVVNHFEDKLQVALEDKEKILEETSSRVEQLARISEQASNDVKKEFDELKELTLELTKQLELMRKDYSEMKNITNRRLEILKSAMQAMELEIEQFYGEDTTEPGK